MSARFEIRCDAQDIAGLHEEILRRDRIIAALVRQIEQTSAIGSNSGLPLSLEGMKASTAGARIGVVVTHDHLIASYNRQFARMFGFDADEGVGQDARILFCSEEAFEAANAITDLQSSAPKILCNDACLRHRDGSNIWVHSIGYAVPSTSSGVSAVWIMEDRTAIRKTEEALEQSHEELLKRTLELSLREIELRTVIDNAYDAYVSIDEKGIVQAWNRRAEETFGWSSFEAVGQPLEKLIITPETKKAFRRSLDSLEWVDKRQELPARRRDGSTLMIEIRISVLNFGERHIFSAFLHDITARKQREQQREHEARHDALTGLPNRRELMDQLTKAIARSQRSSKVLNVVFLDLDGFKAVNDNYGHEAGDLLLIRIAQRLKEQTRMTDMVARLAGDEFVIVMEDSSPHEEDARRVSDRLLDSVSLPIEIEGATVQLGCSLGMLVFDPGCQQSAARLIQLADQAMYEAKRSGKGRCVIVGLKPDPVEGKAPPPGSAGTLDQ